MYKGLGGETILAHACRVYVDKWLYWSFGGILDRGEQRGCERVWEAEEQWGTHDHVPHVNRGGTVEDKWRNRRGTHQHVKDKWRNRGGTPQHALHRVFVAYSDKIEPWKKNTAQNFFKAGCFFGEVLPGRFIEHCWCPLKESMLHKLWNAILFIKMLIVWELRAIGRSKQSMLFTYCAVNSWLSV